MPWLSTRGTLTLMLGFLVLAATPRAEATAIWKAENGGQSVDARLTSDTATVRDGDARPYLGLDSPSVQEGDSGTTTLTFTARLTDAKGRTKASDKTITANYQVLSESGDSATPGKDYRAASGTLTFAPGETSKTIDVSVLGDTEVEGDETLTLKWVAPWTNVLLVAYTATGTITNDDEESPRSDARPYLGLDSPSVQEGDSGATTLTFTARLTDAKGQTQASTKTITANYQVLSESGDSATAGKDYQPASGTLTFAPGETSKTIDVSVLGDIEAEGDETLTLKWVAPWTNVLLASYTATGTITDDDEKDEVSAAGLGLTVSLSLLTIGEKDGATNVTVTVAQAQGSFYTEDVDVTVSVGGSGDTATEGTDYNTVNDLTLTIEANSFGIPSSADTTIALTPKQDALYEGNENISVSANATGYTGASTNLTMIDDDIKLTANVTSIHEGGAAQTVTVTATAGSATSAKRGIGVYIGGGNDSATEGTDYATVAEHTINVEANQTTGSTTFTLNPTQDNIAEGDESLSITGWFAGGGSTVGTNIVIYDDEYSLSVNPSGLYEDAGTRQVTVTACCGTSRGARSVRVKVGKSGDTVREGTDYQTVRDFDINMAAGTNRVTGTFDLALEDDGVYGAPTRTITISGTSSHGSVAGTSISIYEDDADPTVTLELDVTSWSEDGGAKTVTVTAYNRLDTYGSWWETDVSVGKTKDSATEGTDYATVADFTIRSAKAGDMQASRTFTLTPTNDATIEGTERISVTGTTLIGNAKVRPAFLSLTDDDATSIALSANKSSVSEGASATTVTVTATAAKNLSAASAITVYVGDSGSADYGIDYAKVSDFTINIASGSKTGTGTFTLTPTDDSSVEGNETIGISGSVTGHSLTGTSLTLSDNDTHAITLSASPDSVAEDDAATSVTVTATAGAAISSARTVTVAVGGSGTATSGTDYAAVTNFDITIAANATSGTGTFTLTPTDDSSVEGDETIGIAGSGTSMTVTGTSLTLTEDDTHAITLSASPDSVAENDAATSVTVTATAGAAISTARTVSVVVGGSGDGATEGTDYATVADTTITIAANATSGTVTFTLTPTQDTSAEGDESIGITGSGTLMTVTGTSLTLTDDDVRTISLSANKATVSEGAGATTVTVTATANSAVSEATTVTVSVGASGDGATEGTDYSTVADFDITIAANKTSGTGTFTLTPTDDTTYEGEESVSVSGSSSPHTVTGTSLAIGNNDGIAITLSASPDSLVEGAGSTSVTVTATAAQTALAAISVKVQVGKSSDSATEGTDYPTVNDFNLTIAKGDSTGTATFSVIPNSDKKDSESSETISVDGSSSPHTVTGASLTLQNATASNPITLSVSPSSVGEGAGATSVTVTARMQTSFQGAGSVTVQVGTSGSAKSGTDYAAVADITLNFTADSPTTATGTFTLTPTDDAVVENNETVWVDGTSAFGQVVGASVTINDNDGAAITLSANKTSVSEGASGTTVTVTATASAASSNARTVTVSVGQNGDSAIEGTDYSDVSNFTITIAADATTGTGNFTLTPTQDDVVEGSESLSISGSGTGLNVTGTSVTITDDDTAPAVNLSVSPASMTEGASDPLNLAGGKTVTVTAAFSTSKTYAFDRTVTVSVGGSGTATSDTDYDAVSDFNVKISAGQKSGTGTFVLKSTDDSVYEGDETIGVAGTSTGLTVNSATLTLDDNDSAAVTINDASAAEGSSMTFTVTLDNAVQGGLTVTPSYTNGTASSSDYTANTTGISFNGTANETKTFTVSTTQDAVVEDDETFTVGLSVSKAPSGVTSSDTGTGTINSGTESNVDTATLTINDASAAEGEGMTFTVTLSEAVQGGLTVTPSFTDGTAVEATDYDENTTALSFTGTKGETKTFTVSTTEDAVLEANETFTVGMTVSGTSLSSRITSSDTGTGTIDNDDSAAVTIADANADEGDGISFTVTLSAAVQGGLKVTPSYTNGTAASTDYTQNTTALTFTGTANETRSFTVSTREDAVLEGDETFTVDLSVSGTALSITATDTGTGTINNDDSAAVTIADANADEGNDVSFTVTLDAAVQGGLKVTPGFTDGTAVEGTDYDENTTALTFTGNANETRTFTVSTTEDALVEEAETFTVGLTVSGTSLSITSSDTATGTINNDDGATVTVNHASADEGESMTFTVTLGDAVQGGLTVTPGFTDVTAVEGTDYDENTTALSFTGAKGETKTFTVSTTEDAVLEANETFTVGLTVSDAPSGITATDTGTGTINNDDGATVTVDDASADEGQSMTFTVTLGDAVQDGLTVTPGFTDGTAVEGTDYDENTTALSFTGTKGETKSFTVSTTQDAVFEGNETFTVDLTVSGTSLSITATDTGTGAINNDDSAEVTIDDASAEEGDGVTFTVTLSEAVQDGLTVTPGYTDSSATRGTDYTENTAALNFTGAKGETKSFTVSTTEEAVVEYTETFTVSLSVSNAPSGITATDTGAGTITDDDSAEVSVNDGSADEGGGVLFTVTLSEAVQGGLTVTPGYTDGTAVEGTDYTANTAPLSFSGTKGETQTFTVATTEDVVLEDNETFTVSLAVSNAPPGVSVAASGSAAASAPVAARAVSTAGGSGTGTGTINNNDEAEVTVDDVSVEEGEAMTFTVKLDAAVQDGLVLTPVFTDGTAARGDDYEENATPLQFSGTAGETKTFTVSTTEEPYVEVDEAFTVGLSVSSTTPGIISADTGTGTIENDDGTTVTIDNAIATEGKRMFFAVTLHEVVAGGLTVTPFFTDETATKGVDYDENVAVMNFEGTKGETWAFGVSTTLDAVLEGDETFTVGLTVSDAPSGVTVDDTGKGTISDGSGAAVTIDDANADEGGDMTFTVTLNEAVQGGITVTPVFTDETATKGVDYEENTAAMTFEGTAGETKTFTVSTTQDEVSEGDETFTVSLTASDAPSGVTVDDTGTGTINDDDGAGGDDTPPEVVIAGPSEVRTDTLDVTITFSEAVTGFELGDVTVGNGAVTAFSGSDSSYAATIAPADSGTVTVDVAADVAHDAAGNGNLAADQYAAVFHAEEPDAALETIIVSPGTLRPPFGAGITHYEVEVENHTACFRIASRMVNGAAPSITVNGRAIVSEGHCDGVGLDVGVTKVVISTPTQTYMVNVTRKENTAPAAPVLEDQTVSAGTAFRYSFDETDDPDAGQTVTYAAAQDGGTQDGGTQDSGAALPAWLIFDAANRTFSGTPTSADVGASVVVVTATDDGVPALSSRASFTLTVVPAPIDGRPLQLALATFGRTVASDAVSVMESRFSSPAAPGTSVTLGGQQLDADRDGGVTKLLFGLSQAAGLEVRLPGADGRPVMDPSTVAVAQNAAGPRGAQSATGEGPGALIRFNRRSAEEVLSASSFDLAVGSEDGQGTAPRWSLWGRGGTSGFSGRTEHGAALDGRVNSSYLGVDYRFDRPVTLGLALSYSAGEIDYLDDTAGSVVADLSMMGVMPYAHWSASPRLDLWGFGMAGWGDVELKSGADAEAVATDFSLRMAALGLRNGLAKAGAVDLALKGDAFTVGLESEASADLAGATADVQRIRLALEARAALTTSLTPRLALGGRWDGGSVENGLGAEVEGGLTYLHAASGWGIEARGRYLLLHQEADFEDWSASARLFFDPGSRDRGLFVVLSPEWGNPNGSGNALWDRAGAFGAPTGSAHAHARGPSSGWNPQRIDLEIGYGAGSPGRLLTSYGGVRTMERGEANYRLGSRMEVARLLFVGLEGERRTSAAGPAESRVMLMGRANW